MPKNNRKALLMEQVDNEQKERLPHQNKKTEIFTTDFLFSSVSLSYSFIQIEVPVKV